MKLKGAMETLNSKMDLSVQNLKEQMTEAFVKKSAAKEERQ